MLELKNVSKFYSSNGMITTGFSRVSLKFDLGEFVAITGESGSGKSTLLNVISGLDSYEEGEMYINGEETSHYTEKDYEIYRRKYVGNIFQNFNLVNSYTVYQNIELVLLLNGKKKSEIKSEIISLIKKVDLYKYRNKKVSKLSGGQKQRVAIARALAMNTPIILADEPTGNLDKKSSESVLKLLYEISKDKLVIIVTHNYNQIEKYVTRKITMHDGKVLEDKKVKDYNKVDRVLENNFSDIKWFNKLCLGIRNAFNIPSKFFLITAVYLFMILSIFSAYSSFEKLEYQLSIEGVSSFFKNISDKRIIIKKNDKSIISEEDYKKIYELNNVDNIIKNDLLLDQNVNLYNGDYLYLYGTISNIDEIGKLDYGRVPSNDNEIVVALSNDYYIDNENERNSFLENNFIIDINGREIDKLKIVGIKKIDNDTFLNSDSIFYVTDNLQKKLSDEINRSYSRLSYKFGEISGNSYFDTKILPSNKVTSGKMVIPEEWTMQCKNFNCKNTKVKVNVNNLYFDFDKEFTVYDNYNSKKFKKLTGYNYEKYNGAIFINEKDYNDLFDRGYYQSSVFIKDVKDVKNIIKSLNDLGYTTLYIPDVLVDTMQSSTAGLKIARLLVLTILFVTLFFISYFIIKLVFKSRNVYYSTLRILGSSYKCTKSLLNIELLVLVNISYLIFVIFLMFVKSSIINNSLLNELSTFMNFTNYAVIYIIVIIMSLLITMRYSRKLFNDSAMNSYREEV